MPQESTTQNPFDTCWRDWQNLAMENIATATRQMVSSDTYYSAMNASMDVYLSGYKKFRQAMQLSLEALDLPQRADLARLSTQISSAEARAIDCQERLDQTQDTVAALIQRIHQLEASQAELQRQLDKPAAPPAAPKKSATPKSATLKSATTGRKK